jgi:outer membrane immunogenic protein
MGVIMKHIAIALLTGVGAFVGLNGATAAPPTFAPPPSYSWAGPYLGLAGGFSWGHSTQTDPGFIIPAGGGGGIIGGLGDGSFSLNGGLIGGVAGYNLQYGQWV